MARAKVADVTGRQREAGIKAAEEAVNIRSREMAMATATAQHKLETEVLDLTGYGTPTILDEVESVGPTLADGEYVIITTNEDIDFMTIGVGNHYSFRAGQKTKVLRSVADHLQEKGYVATRI